MGFKLLVWAGSRRSLLKNLRSLKLRLSIYHWNLFLKIIIKWSHFEVLLIKGIMGKNLVIRFQIFSKNSWYFILNLIFEKIHVWWCHLCHLKCLFLDFNLAQCVEELNSFYMFHMVWYISQYIVTITKRFF